ncbi:MAG: hypothetical protein JGK01_15910 [Microcoleus sp. PH2017_03_ELD_O_A]|nr:hypothetical protein [Microcoleus sp. PH2017_03_ELD_O_A]
MSYPEPNPLWQLDAPCRTTNQQKITKTSTVNCQLSTVNCQLNNSQLSK